MPVAMLIASLSSASSPWTARLPRTTAPDTGLGGPSAGLGLGLRAVAAGRVAVLGEEHPSACPRSCQAAAAIFHQGSPAWRRLATWLASALSVLASMGLFGQGLAFGAVTDAAQSRTDRVDVAVVVLLRQLSYRGACLERGQDRVLSQLIPVGLGAAGVNCG